MLNWSRKRRTVQAGVIGLAAACMAVGSGPADQDADPQLPQGPNAPESGQAEQTIPTDIPQAVSDEVQDVNTPPGIRFNFKGATFDQVIEFFSRITGKPVIWETPAPEGTLDYLSSETYDLHEALRILNVILQARGVTLRVTKDMLYLQKLSEMQREDIPTFIGQLPGDVPPDQVITVVRPLKMALAKPLAEKLSGMVATYGAVTAMEQQNALVITETAANSRRLLTMIDQLDLEDPEGAVEVFPIRHAKVAELTTPLRALLSQRIEKYVINQEGKQVKIEEEQLPGLSISADERTNSIIAKGTQNRIDKLEEAIRLLDVPATGGLRTISSLALAQVTAAEAAAKLNQLFAALPQDRRPTVLALEDAAKIMIVGDDSAVTEGSLLIRELEGDSRSPDALHSVTETIALEHAESDAVITAVTSLLTDRQKRVVKLVAAPDGRSLVVSGPQGDLESVKAIVQLLDRPGPVEQRVRVFRLLRGDPRHMVDLALRLFEQQRERDDPHTKVQVELDTDARRLTVLGSSQAVERFTETLRQIEDTIVVDREVRRVRMSSAKPGEVIESLTMLARQFLEPPDGGPYLPPMVTAVDELNLLVITATPEQFPILESLIASLDVPGKGPPVVRVKPLKIADAASVREALAPVVARMQSKVTGEAVSAGITAAPDSNALILVGLEEDLNEIEALIAPLDAERVTDQAHIRTVFLEHARAEHVAPLVEKLLSTEEVPIGMRSVAGRRNRLIPDAGPPIKVAAVASLNAVVVSGPPPILDLAEHMLAQLDVDPSEAGRGDPRTVRVLVIENADATALAANLEALLTGPDQPDPKPIIRVDGPSNVLLVRATDQQFRTIEQVVNDLDRANIASSRQMKMVRIDPARASAAEIARMLQRILGRADQTVQVMTLEELLKRNEQDENESVPPDASSSLLTPLWGQIHTLALCSVSEEEEESTPQDADGGYSIAVDESTNSLILIGPPRGIDRLANLIGQIQDQIPEAPTVIHHIGMPAGQNVQALADVLNQALARIIPAGGRPGDLRQRIAVLADPVGQALIVAANEPDFETVADLIAVLAKPAASEFPVRLFPLERGNAAVVARGVQQFFTDRARMIGLARSGRSVSAISLTAIEPSNAILVSAPEAEIAEVESLIRELDTIAPPSGQGVFILELKHIAPDAARSVIESIGLTQPQPVGSGTRLVSQPIKVTTLAGRQAIIIVGDPTDREAIVGLVSALDAEPALAEAELRVIVLTHARAEALAEILGQILRPSDQQAGTPLARAVQEQVRRLQVARLPEPPNGDDGSVNRPTEERPAGNLSTLDLTKPVRIVPNPAMNALIVSSTPDNIQAITELIAMFDQLPITDAVTVQIFPLQNIAADQFSRILRELFSQGKQLSRRAMTNIIGVPIGAVGKALLEELAISVDERTNTVIVAGTEDAVALAEVLAQRIDSEVAIGWVEPRILPLRYADAGDLAETLQAILVEGASNRPQSSPLQRQIARLRVARLEEHGGQVLESELFTPMAQLLIRAEPNLNALILVGTPDNLEVVTELVSMLDIESASPAHAVRIYPVAHASAARLAQTIRQLFDQQVQSKTIREEDRVVIQADDRTNALVASSSPRSFAVLEELLKTLDTALPPDVREIRTIEVTNASATRLASIIQSMMDARLERLRRLQPETADLERAMIVADPRTNRLVIAAGSDAFEVIARLAADLDQFALDDASLVHVLPIEGGNVERVAEAVNRVMERRYAEMPEEVRRSQRPLIMTDPRSNSLLVAANPEDLSSIEDLVNRLAAAPMNPAVGIHLITLPPPTRAELLAPRVERLMQERRQSLGEAGTSSDRVRIEPDLASNSLIVAANDENVQIIRGLIDLLVKAEAEAAVEDQNDRGVMIPGREMEIVMLRASRAADVIDLLGDLYVEEANRTRGAHTVRVTADDRLNAIIINAPPADVQALKDLIGQLDGAKPASVIEIKYVPLQSANALETVSLIESVLSGRGIGARGGSRQATVLKYLHEIARDGGDESRPVEMEVSAAIRESITLTPDLRTNTIIVAAPQNSINMIEQMIRDLDESSTGSRNIRIFKLVNADALAMAEIITDLFNLRRGENLYVLKPREDQPLAASRDLAEPSQAILPAREAASGVARAPEGAGISGAELTAIPDERQQLAVTVDSRTNSLIVSGTPTYLDLVTKVMEELDRLEANEREVFVYRLRNAAAGDVARAIGGFVEREQQKLLSTLGPDQLGSAARLLEREVTIQSDEKSNTVLVSASPRYLDRVKEMIRQLDVDPPQVLIQVMLAEVTLETKDEWGVDLTVRGRAGNADISAGFGLGSAFVTGMGVPNLAIASSDFDLLIRAMRAQGRLHVLSNPSIMVANNEEARIQVGETIRLPESTAFNLGAQQTSVVPEDIGVILTVKPSINPDGFVRMEINPEISSLSARTTQITEDFQSPIITRRRAETTVTVKDGQTIVLGGLISDRYERRDRKVPGLGDAPVIGPLFRSDTEETAKTELLIVLTPHVIESPAEVSRINMLTNFQIDRLSLPPDVKNSIRRSILEGTGGLYDAEGNRIDVNEDGDEP